MSDDDNEFIRFRRSNENELPLALCEALGIDARTTTKLVLTCEVGTLPTLDVTSVLVNDVEVDGDRLIETLSQYELRPR